MAQTFGPSKGNMLFSPGKAYTYGLRQRRSEEGTQGDSANTGNRIPPQAPVTAATENSQSKDGPESTAALLPAETQSSDTCEAKTPDQAQPGECNEYPETGVQTPEGGPANSSPGTRLTFGVAIQSEVSRVILDGTAEHAVNSVRDFIQWILRLLQSTDAGAEVVLNLIRRVREELEKEITVDPQTPSGTDTGETSSGLALGTEPGKPEVKAGILDPAMLRVMWSLFKTPEFQQFTAKVVAQSLKDAARQIPDTSQPQ
jgi:hypothetical protein